MRRLPTDLEILNEIYEGYYAEYANYDENDEHRRLVKI